MKRKYDYTEKQENAILETTEILSFVLGCIAVVAFTGVFPEVSVALIVIAAVSFVLFQLYKTARVINHRRKVSSQDDNIEPTTAPEED